MKEYKVTGLIPAAGTASRLAPLPFSKELYPIHLDHINNHQQHPKTVMHYLLEQMRGAADSILVVIRDGKWDIPSYFGDGTLTGVPIGYLMMGVPFGPPYTINQAYPFIKDHIVLLGFPDILITPTQCYKALVEQLRSSQSDAVAGLYRVQDPEKWDMVRLNQHGFIEDIIIKKDQPYYDLAWATIAWKPSFTEFMNAYLSDVLSNDPNGRIIEGEVLRELIISDIINAAIRDGLKIEGHLFDDGKILDVGTTDGIMESREFFNL